MPAKTSNRTDPWAALDALMKTEPEPMGPEWFTVDQFATRYGISNCVAQDRLNRMTTAGTTERWKGTSRSNNRITCKFRLKP